MYFKYRGHRGRRVVGFKTTYAISTYHHKHCEFKPSSGEVKFEDVVILLFHIYQSTAVILAVEMTAVNNLNFVSPVV
jgi:hypothetical protein